MLESAGHALAYMEATSNKKLLVAPGIATRKKKLLGTKGIATRNKDATSSFLLLVVMPLSRVAMPLLLVASLDWRRVSQGSTNR